MKFLFALILIVSCASQKKTIKKTVDSKTEIISYEEDYKKTVEKVEKIEEVEILENKENKIKKIDLYLLASGSNAYAYVGLLKKLSKMSRVRVVGISGSGFSSIIAALYAKYKSANMVEWKLFKMRDDLMESQFYSKSWRDRLITFIDNEFSEDKKLKVPYLEITGTLNDYLKSQLETRNLMRSKKNFIYVSALNETFNKGELNPTDFNQLRESYLYHRGHEIYFEISDLEEYPVDILSQPADLLSIGQNFSFNIE